MSQYRWEDCPPGVRAQGEEFVCAVREMLADDLVGVYLHGSLAMGCFNPARSDMDLLVVTEQRMTPEVKRRAAELLLRLSQSPRPIEISFLTRQNLDPWQFPTPFDLHYGEEWRARYQYELASGAWRVWSETGRDPDLAAHVTILRHRGIVLTGESIDRVFPDVPREDYLASIWADAEDCRDRVGEMPVYAVLNLCRVWWYLKEGRICSKDEAGAWARAVLPHRVRGVVSQALDLYRGSTKESQFVEDDLRKFVEYVHDQAGPLHAAVYAG